MVSRSPRFAASLMVLGALVIAGSIGLTPAVSALGPAAAITDPPGAWTTGPALSTSRTEVAAAVLNGVLHVVGQYPGSSGPPGAHEAYDPALGRWEVRAALPADLHHACAAAI